MMGRRTNATRTQTGARDLKTFAASNRGLWNLSGHTVIEKNEQLITKAYCACHILCQ